MNDMVESPSPVSNETPPISKGERWFNWLTYGGIAGVLVFLAGIPITYWARHTKSGTNFLNSSTKLLTKTGMSERTAEQVMLINALSMAGNLSVIPIKKAEDSKHDLVKMGNEMLGDTTDCAHLKDERSQDWMSIIKSRAVAWGAVFAAFRGVEYSASKWFNKPKALDNFEHWFSENIYCRLFKKPTHTLVEGVMQETRAFRIGKIAALDIFSTSSAAFLLYLGSRFFAKKETKTETENNTLVATQPDNAETVSTTPENAATSPNISHAAIARRDAPQSLLQGMHKPASYLDRRTHASTEAYSLST